jgi:glycosyltransferase involved in cell wall biosynthesis
MGSTLTIVALAWNESAHLPRCFASLRPLIEKAGAETLVLFDPAGDAATLEVARRVADRVEMHPFTNFAAQRNRALDLSGTRWVFFIDPDERMTPELAEEIARAVQGDALAAYRVPRRNILFGREVRHTGWYPDYQVRLLERQQCRYNESLEVHEVPDVMGGIGTFSAPLIHFNYRTWGQFYRKQLAYSGLHARALYSAGHRARLRSVVGQPLRELKRRLVDYRGYSDGLLGVALSFAMALYTLLVYVKLLRLQRRLR